MATATPLVNSTVLSPAQIERSKTRQEKAEDIIYTLNHSITCLSITDTVGLGLAANAFNLVTGGNLKIEHDHNTGYGPLNWLWDRMQGKHKDSAHVAAIHHKEDHRIAHELEHAAEHMAEDIKAGRKPIIHPDPAYKLTPEEGFGSAAKKFWNNSKKWLIAEAVGDLGSVPVTIALQRYAPGFMQSVRNMIEPVIGGSFRRNTQRAAENWGKAHGKAANSQEVKEYAHELYEYEMKHMPQMAVWTVSSVGLNFAAMHAFHHINPRQFERTSMKEFALVKGLGAAMTAGLVLGVRGLTPGGAHKWDQSVGKHVVVPITKAVGSLVGVESKDVDDFQKRRQETEAHEKGTPAATIDPAPKNRALDGRVEAQPELAAGFAG